MRYGTLLLLAVLLFAYAGCNKQPDAATAAAVAKKVATAKDTSAALPPFSINAICGTYLVSGLFFPPYYYGAGCPCIATDTLVNYTIVITRCGDSAVICNSFARFSNANNGGPLYWDSCCCSYPAGRYNSVTTYPATYQFGGLYQSGMAGHSQVNMYFPQNRYDSVYISAQWTGINCNPATSSLTLSGIKIN